jgi:hypothetical protein
MPDTDAQLCNRFSSHARDGLSEVGPDTDRSGLAFEASVRQHFETLHVTRYSLALVAIEPTTKSCEQRFFELASDAVAFARRWNGKRNLYISVNLFPTGHLGGRTRGEVAALQGVLVDLDPDDGSSRGNEGVLAVLRGVVSAAADALGFPCSAVLRLFSGRGAHGVLLGDPITLKSGVERDRANGIGKQFLQKLSAEPSVCDLLKINDLRIDRTGDSSRVMRLAGTRNLKTGQVAHFDPTGPSLARWDGLASLADHLGEQALERPECPLPATTSVAPYPANGGSPYGIAALQREAEAVRMAPRGERNTRLNRAAFSCGQLVAGAELDRKTTEKALFTAATSAGLGEQEAALTIRSGLAGGGDQPRRASRHLWLRSIPPRE